MDGGKFSYRLHKRSNESGSVLIKSIGRCQKKGQTRYTSAPSPSCMLDASPSCPYPSLPTSIPPRPSLLPRADPHRLGSSKESRVLRKLGVPYNRIAREMALGGGRGANRGWLANGEGELSRVEREMTGIERMGKDRRVRRLVCWYFVCPTAMEC